MYSSVPDICTAIFLYALLPVATAQAPGDEDLFCMNLLNQSAIPANADILMDSYNYIRLLPVQGQSNNVWQQVDNDDNSDTQGSGTGASVSG